MLESGLSAITAGIITELFMWVLLVVFGLSLYWKKNNKHNTFTNYAPTLLTSLGILGTFTGIIIGLLDFDTKYIQESIGPLLDGLKTAFITSLVGMLFSIVFKGIVSSGVLAKNIMEGEKLNEVDASDIYAVMETQVVATQELNKSIGGGDESSLIGQLKLMRSDASDAQKNTRNVLDKLNDTLAHIQGQVHLQTENFTSFEDRLWIKLQDFADMMSKSATEQVIEALKQVISDFNNNLTEQFGENFKQLNEAVLKLVEWQDNYKGQLSDMQEKYALGVQAITYTEKSVGNISEEVKNIPITMEKLKNTIDVNQHQIDELDRHLEAFKDIRDKAVEAVPDIRKQIDMAIEGATEANTVLAKGMQDSAENMGKILADNSEEFKNSVSQTNAAITESAQATANTSEQIKKDFASTLEDINNHNRNLIDELTTGGKNLNENYQAVVSKLIIDIEAMSKSLASGLESTQATLQGTIEEQAVEGRKQAGQILTGLNNAVEDALKSTGESVKKQVEMIDAASEREITQIMTAMGGALTTITNKFTQDYQRLVKEMERVVNTTTSN